MLLSEERFLSAVMSKLGTERVISGLQDVPKPQERQRLWVSFWEATQVSFRDTTIESPFYCCEETS